MAKESLPANAIPGNPQNPPPIGNSLPPINWIPFQALSRALVFLLGIVFVFLFLDFAGKLAVADGGKRDTPLLAGREFLVVGLVISYFAISAAGMAFAKRKTTLIKFALAAYLALVLAFAIMGHASMIKHGVNPGYSLNNIISCVGEIVFLLQFLLPWHIVWLLKLLAKEKHAAQTA